MNTETTAEFLQNFAAPDRSRIRSRIARDLPSAAVVKALLKDHTTEKNIIWATDTYAEFGFHKKDEIDADSLISRFDELMEIRSGSGAIRTRKHGEVFTPFSTVREMCDYAHEALWAGDWRKYVDAKVMEITCGEAPFLASRKDLLTGEPVDLASRAGLLDRKLRLVNENARDMKEWRDWSRRAYQSTYAYEFQGDNLFLARLNLFATYEEYFRARWDWEPSLDDRRKILELISWNIWQMDGLSGAIPYGDAKNNAKSLLNLSGGDSTLCEIRDWIDRKIYLFNSLKSGEKMKFDFIIGNPPYQEESVGDQKNFTPAVYHLYMKETFKLAKRVELIHPARFLFNGGSTPKEWNLFMLNNSNYKILKYYTKSKDIFPNTDIKGGIAISYYDILKTFEPIKIFTKYEILNNIINKIFINFIPLSSIAISSYSYHFTPAFHNDFPDAKNILSKGHENDLKTNTFVKLTKAFFINKPDDNFEYIKILGRLENERVFKYIRKVYINEVINLFKFKIFLAGANGAGELGEVLSSPIIGKPGEGATESFLSIGCFDTIDEANAALKYIKSRFARILLGILKTTQSLTPQKWDYVPLQDFTSNSDIDWSKSVAEIDRQLYAKYGLDEKEIEFIETHAKEMK